MIANLVCELHRLDFRLLRMSLILCLLFLLFEEKFSIVDDLCHDDSFLRSDFYEIHIELFGSPERFISTHLPKIFSCISDDNEFSCKDCFVDTLFVFFLRKRTIHGLFCRY